MATRRRTKTWIEGHEPWRDLIQGRPGVEDLPGAHRLPVASIDANPDQPRKGPVEGIEELAASIREYGLLQPIVVSPVVAGRYTVIAGHRRLAAYRLLAEADNGTTWDAIPAIERDTDTADRLVLALLENLSRQDLTDREIIAGLTVLRDLRGWPQVEIARRMGVTEGWISKYFRVAGDAEVSPHVQGGTISAGMAYEIVVARAPDAKAQALQAALEGATQPMVRRLARGQGHAGPRPNFRNESPETPTASAATAAGVRDIADLAGELHLRLDLGETQLLALFRAALEAQTADVSLADFIRAARADLRLADALVRAAPQRRHRR